MKYQHAAAVSELEFWLAKKKKPTKTYDWLQHLIAALTLT